MLNNCMAFLVLVIIGCFAAGAAAETHDKAERKRIERHVRQKYGKTY